MTIMHTPPLSLYIHIPWCVQKCPYCDFNSHGQKQTLPESSYIQHLLDDFETDYARVAGRKINTVFIGGGTPSLFSADGIAALLQGIRQRADFAHDAEITLEANPGTVESEKFVGFSQAGVNRISIGVQSFQKDKLAALGRIHDDKQALNAATYAHHAGLNSFNMDLMHGLPQQSVDDALSDLRTAIEQTPPHLSWYQLTIEPNTQFHSKPPVLPEDEVLWDIQDRGHQLLTDAGYQQYEISAYAQAGQQCQHNLNYWRFGDYIGIGCGAHGKLSFPELGEIWRTEKVKHPRGYMDLSKAYLYKQWRVDEEDLPFEFFMNRFRLLEACPKEDYPKLTGHMLPEHVLQNLAKACERGLLNETLDTWQLTEMGKRYLNSVLESLV